MKRVSNKEKILLRTSWISTVGNMLLSAAKIAIGLFSGSLAVLGDGIDSATDVLISIVMVCTANIMKRPPDPKYVFGYEKAEGIATKILSLVIFYAGVQMLISSGKAIFSGEVRELPGMLAIYVTLFSIAGKFGLAWYQFRQGKRINSSMLKANAVNMRNDVLISTAVLVGLVFTFILNLPILDAVTGLIVSFFILKSSVEIFMESNTELMDGVKDTSVYNRLFEAIDGVKGAQNPHRVRIRQFGGLYAISLDIEADENITLREAHNIADAVENSIRKSIENIYDIVVHVEPQGRHNSHEKYGVDRKMLD
ncbi:MAG: cation diffusion facilitator family transporter [Prevotellaceae bacterium]|jgi:cation diffusion facilitator family transporter|nr:cation diffusion facilitator family transporter [Prevotellaceae bacterium]